jgi:hypothetical protein
VAVKERSGNFKSSNHHTFSHYQTSHGPISLYLHAARWFPLATDPFTSLEDVLYEGIEAEFSELREDAEDQSEEPLNKSVCT